MKIAAISGSLRRKSFNRGLLAAMEAMRPGDVQWQTLEIRLPLYDGDLDVDGGPPDVIAFKQAIADADAVIIATPEYNYGIPGPLKNAIDWASRPYPDNVLRGKPVAVIGASTGLFGAVWAQAELRKSLRHTGAHVLDDELPVGTADHAFTPSGELVDPELNRRLADLIEQLGREVWAPVELAS